MDIMLEIVLVQSGKEYTARIVKEEGIEFHLSRKEDDESEKTYSVEVYNIHESNRNAGHDIAFDDAIVLTTGYLRMLENTYEYENEGPVVRMSHSDLIGEVFETTVIDHSVVDLSRSIKYFIYQEWDNHQTDVGLRDWINHTVQWENGGRACNYQLAANIPLLEKHVTYDYIATPNTAKEKAEEICTRAGWKLIMFIRK